MAQHYKIVSLDIFDPVKNRIRFLNFLIKVGCLTPREYAKDIREVCDGAKINIFKPRQSANPPQGD